jgi:hypothetical protein
MPTKKVAYIYPENLFKAAIREIFDHHWQNPKSHFLPTH